MSVLIRSNHGLLDLVADDVVTQKEVHCEGNCGWFGSRNSSSLLKEVLTGKSIFIVWRRCKGSLSSENEIRDLRVMRKWIK